jgi:Tfp pilus assembly protein PilO
MEQLTRYRIPILTGVGALVFAIIVFAMWISPQGGKLSSLHAQATQLQSQESHLQTELAMLRRDRAQMASNCQLLTRDLSEVPGTPSVDSFFHQITTLAVSSGDPNTPSISVTQASGAAAGNVKPVAVSLTLQGTYGQMMGFLRGLDSFPRIFTVTTINVNGAPVAIGGVQIPDGTAGYNLQLTGNVYYSTGQQNVCSGATTTSHH